MRDQLVAALTQPNLGALKGPRPDNDYQGEGLTATEALTAALDQMRKRIEKRAARDRETLAALGTQIEPNVSTLPGA